MKSLIFLIVMFVGFVASAQTNTINIYNSRVIINNYITQQETNVVKQTVLTNKFVLLPLETVERLKWENMLDQRRQTAFKSYLKKYEK